MSEEARASENVTTLQDLPGEFCPLCSARLQSRKCKMVCPRCGYFMSCSEFG